MTTWDQARQRIHEAIVGQDDAIEALLIAAASGGHVLMDGVPGLGKTSLARAFSRITGRSIGRVQMTPDLLPADITGHTFLAKGGDFQFRSGAVFNDILIADEINRAPPRTQAALLEAMQERQVTVDGTTYPLPADFMVIATRNPREEDGTFPMPASEMDRFMFLVPVTYLSEEDEATLLRTSLTTESALEPIPDLVSTLQAGIEDIRAHPDIVDYIVRLCHATRRSSALRLGASTRAAKQWLDAARGRALLRSRAFVTPDDVKAVAPLILAHRLQLAPETQLQGITIQDVLDALLRDVEAPVKPGRGRKASRNANEPPMAPQA